MQTFDAEMLARLQFAFTVSIHILFPALSIGLSSYLAVLNGLSLFTQNPVYLRLFNYWKNIFTVPFGMGVVSGVVMSYQFGTNWSVFSDKAGPVIGPLMGYEVLTAFFLESGFLGVMLFGRSRVGPKLHFFATAMVALGTLFSTFWILAVNSWMQTPAGYVVNDVGQFAVTDWWTAIFTPSFSCRFPHMVIAAYLTTAFVVGGVGALHLLRGRSGDAQVRVMFSMAMWMAAIVTPAQMLVGDLSGLNTLKYQPAKIAALEGHFKSEADAPEILIGIPNEAKERIDYAISIPKAGSLILTHSVDGVVPGVLSFPPDERPPMFLIFFTFRIMVGMGLLMLAVGLWSLWARHKKQLYSSKWLHRAALVVSPAGLVAVLCGWITTEVGRQPYTVYHLLRTDHSMSPLAAPAVGGSLIAFIVIYFTVFGAGVYYTLRMMNQPPSDGDELPLNYPTHAGAMALDAAVAAPSNPHK